MSLINRLIHLWPSVAHMDRLEVAVAQQVAELEQRVDHVQSMAERDPDRLARLVHDVRGATFERRAERGDID